MNVIPDNELLGLLEEKPVVSKPNAEGADCGNCPLRDKPIAPTQGPKDAKTIVVSRSPGFHEAVNGKPFSGPSGKILNHLLKQNGVSREEIKLTNVVLCAPPKGEVPKEAIKACSPRLAKEIESTNLVIAAGSEPVNALIGRGSIDGYRGYTITNKRDGRSYIATNNPALVLYDDSTFPNIVKDFKRAFHPIPAPILPEVTLFREEEECVDFLKSIARGTDSGGTIAIDIEGRGGLSQFSSLVTIQFSISGNKAVVLGEPGIVSESALRYLKLFLESDRRFIYHNGKWDTKVLRTTYGINAKVDEDTLLLSYALDERSGGDDMVGVHGLEYLLMEEFGWPKYETRDVHDFKRDGIVRDWQELALYAGRDVAGTKQLFNLYRPQVASDPGLEKAYREKLIKGNEALTKAELHGMVYDINGAADILENEVYPELSNLTQRMREISEVGLLNPGSPKQLANLFYDRWNIHHAMRKRPDKDRSVDDTARKEIIEGRYAAPDEHRTTVQAFLPVYDRYQKLSKQASTYLLALIKKAENDPRHENRIYTEFQLHGTNSGRPSARNPNLLNITRSGRHSEIPDIRRLFRASQGRRIVSFDYSQAELRCIACFSRARTLQEVYEKSLDLHSLTAERFFGKDFTNENRQNAKNMNFGVPYQQTAETFLEKHGIAVDEARPFITWWRQEFPEVFEWHTEVAAEIRSNGFVRSPFGRKRRFYLITNENKNAIVREGINFLPQSTASDLTLESFIILSENVDWKKAALCLTVYDSIVADVVESYIDEFRTLGKQVMESRAKDSLGWTLPFLVDTGVGQTWAEAK